MRHFVGPKNDTEEVQVCRNIILVAVGKNFHCETDGPVKNVCYTTDHAVFFLKGLQAYLQEAAY